MIPFELDLYVSHQEKYKVLTRDGKDAEIGAINLSPDIKQGHEVIGWLVVHHKIKEVYAWDTTGKLYGWHGHDYPYDLFLEEL